MVHPPGPGYLYVVTDAGVPSFGHEVMIGMGASPPVDQAAIDNMLAQTHGQLAAIAAVVEAARPPSGEGSEGY